MASAIPELIESPKILAKLDEVRGVARRYVVLQGICQTVFWGFAVFWIGGLIDYLPVRAGASETPRNVRVLMLGVMVLGALWFLGVKLLPRLFTRLKDRSLALLIERHYPDFDNELITTVELTGERVEVSNLDAHSQMLGRVTQLASDHIDAVDPATLFNWRPLWTNAGTALLILVFTIGCAFGMPGWMSVWSQRLFGLSDVLWPRRAELRFDGVQIPTPTFTGQLSAERTNVLMEDSTVHVPLGTAALLQVSADTTAVETPEVCTLYYRATDGSSGRVNLRRVGADQDGWQPFILDGPPLDGLNQDLYFDVVGLDARLRDIRLSVVDPASISELNIATDYPDYLSDSLRDRPASEILKYRSGLRIPEGSKIRLEGTASTSLSLVQYVVNVPDVEHDGDEVHILDAKPDGSQFTVVLGGLMTSRIVEVRLFDQYGLPALEIPRYLLVVQEDTLPNVDVRLDGIGSAVTVNAQLPFTGSVQDDYGIQRVSVELLQEGSTPLDLELVVEDEEELSAMIDLRQLQEDGILALEPGNSISASVVATDFYDLTEEPHIGRGNPQPLMVVTPDQLLVILDRQELEQRQRLELIVSELTETRQLLVNIQSDLSLIAKHSENEKADESEAETASSETLGDQWRRAAVRAQQSVLQGDKSQQELSSLAARVDNLRKQLVNNRIDSYDRQERLQKKVYQPLRALLAGEYPVFVQQLQAMQVATAAGNSKSVDAPDPGSSISTVNESVLALDAVLLALDDITANMLDIESFNEIVDLFRGLLDDQDNLLEQTEQEQRQRLLDLLN